MSFNLLFKLRAANTPIGKEHVDRSNTARIDQVQGARNRNKVLGGLNHSVSRIGAKSSHAISVITILLGIMSKDGVMANDYHDSFRAYVGKLRTSRSVNLMIIPSGVQFRFRVDEIRLPKVSCVYHIDSGSESFAALTSVINDEVTGYRFGSSQLSEVRIGILFNGSPDANTALYFEDWRGDREIKGAAGDHELSAFPTLPQKLRAVAQSQGARLVSNAGVTCP